MADDKMTCSTCKLTFSTYVYQVFHKECKPVLCRHCGDTVLAGKHCVTDTARPQAYCSLECSRHFCTRCGGPNKGYPCPTCKRGWGSTFRQCREIGEILESFELANLPPKAYRRESA